MTIQKKIEDISFILASSLLTVFALRYLSVYVIGFTNLELLGSFIIKYVLSILVIIMALVLLWKKKPYPLSVGLLIGAALDLTYWLYALHALSRYGG